MPSSTSMDRLLMLGGGTFAAAVAASLAGRYEVDFLDDCPERAVVARGRVIGEIDALERLTGEYAEAIVAMGRNERRLELTRRLLAAGYAVPSLVHPTAFVASTATLGPGCILRAHAVADEYVALGAACLLNIGALVDHHCVLGDGVHCKMGSVVRGQRTVEALRIVGCHEALE